MISTFSATIRNSTRPHTHVVHELISGVSGAARLRVNGSKYDIGPSQTILVPAGIPHHYEPADPENTADVTIVCFDGSAPGSQVTAAAMSQALAEETALLIRLLKSALDEGSSHAKHKAEHILASILVNHRASAETRELAGGSDKFKKIHKTLEWINGHLDEELNIDATAAMSHMSRSTFTRSFKQYTSLSFAEYVTSARLRAASDLLSRGGLPIGEVAWRSGFRNIGHFYNQFHKQYGMTPSQYRKVSI